MTVTLLTPHYACTSAERQRELEFCLEQNLANDCIDRIVVFANGRSPGIESSRIECVRISERPTYADLLDYAKAHLRGRTCLIANSDIHFDESLSYFDDVDFSHTCLVVGGRDNDDGAAPVRGRPFEALACRAPLDDARADFAMGSVAGEGRLAWEMQQRKVTVRDVRSRVNAVHVHRAAERSEHPVCEGPTSPVPEPVPDAPKVWGIGLQRTGTSSFCKALNILGIPTLELYGAWFLVKLRDGRLEFDPSVNHTYFQGYADSPVPLYYRELDAMFPGSRFVYTTRTRHNWVRSVERLFRSKPYWDEMPEGEMYNAFHELSYGVADFERDAFLEGYEGHEHAVLEHFRDRPGDLLVMDCDEPRKWENLCGFLARPVPEVQYPHANRRSFRPLWTIRRLLTGRIPRPDVFRVQK